MGDYFGNRRRGNSVTQERLNAPLPPPGGRSMSSARLTRQPSRETLRTPSSIRIRRLPSNTAVPQTQSRPISQVSEDSADYHDPAVSGRRRSSSAPQRYGANLAPPAANDLSRLRTAEEPHMQTITEGAPLPRQGGTPYFEPVETPGAITPSINVQTPSELPAAERVATGASAMNSAGNAAQRARGLRRYRSGATAINNQPPAADEYEADVVDLLDLVGMQLLYH